MRDTHTEGSAIVRAYRPGHIDLLYAAVTESIPELARYETWCHPGYTRDEAAEYVKWWMEAREKDKAYYFAVEERETGEFLGSCGLSGLVMDHKRGGLGFWIRSSRTGRGHATDAARAVSRLGFEDLGLERIEVEIAVDNAASRRVAEKLECKFEGVLSRRLILPAGPTDTAMYSLLKPPGSL